MFSAILVSRELKKKIKGMGRKERKEEEQQNKTKTQAKEDLINYTVKHGY
jgi:hypothetical protein